MTKKLETACPACGRRGKLASGAVREEQRSRAHAIATVKHVAAQLDELVDDPLKQSYWLATAFITLRTWRRQAFAAAE